MDIRSTLFIIILFSLALGSCQKGDDSGANELSQKILVEGYVFANEPVKVKMGLVDSRGSSSSLPASGAQVVIRQNGMEIQMVEHDTIPGIYIQEDQSIILTDTGYVSLGVVHGGHSHSAQTIFPPKLMGLEISNSEIYIEPGNSVSVVATLSWTPVENAIGYCLFARNTYPSATPILNDYSSSSSPFSKINYSNTVDLMSTDFMYVGSYQIYVTAIGPEYQLMYSGFYNGNLLAAPSNIDGGWGVFTAFNGQAIAVNIQ